MLSLYPRLHECEKSIYEIDVPVLIDLTGIYAHFAREMQNVQLLEIYDASDSVVSSSEELGESLAVDFGGFIALLTAVNIAVT